MPNGKSINLKLETNLLEELDKKLYEHKYNNKEEFIVDAIKEKLSDFKKSELLKEISKLRGISKRKTSDEQLHKAGEKAFNILDEIKNF